MTMTMGCGRSKSRSRSRRINFPRAGKVKMTVSCNFALFEKTPNEIGEENNLVHNDCLKLMPHQ